MKRSVTAARGDDRRRRGQLDRNQGRRRIEGWTTREDEDDPLPHASSGQPAAARDRSAEWSSTGDEAIEKEILDSLDGKRIGYDVLHFTIVSANRRNQTLDVIVDGAIVLKAGTINVQGETTFHTIQVG